MEQVNQSSQKSAGALQHFYVAVGSAKAKLETLIELINALNSAASRSLVICCGSRDVLDTVTATVHTLEAIQLWCLHADLSERDIEAAVQEFRQQGHLPGTASGVGGNPEHESSSENKSLLKILLCTDAPLRALSKEAIPLAPTVLIHCDIPTRKEVYQRRIASVLGSRARVGGGQRISISFVEAGKVAEFRQLESFAEKEIYEMPVHVADIFPA